MSLIGLIINLYKPLGNLYKPLPNLCKTFTQPLRTFWKAFEVGRKDIPTARVIAFIHSSFPPASQCHISPFGKILVNLRIIHNDINGKHDR